MVIKREKESMDKTHLVVDLKQKLRYERPTVAERKQRLKDEVSRAVEPNKKIRDQLPLTFWEGQRIER